VTIFKKLFCLIALNIRNRKVMEIKVYFLFFKSCLRVAQYSPVIVTGN
jgi:hypothetical protein